LAGFLRAPAAHGEAEDAPPRRHPFAAGAIGTLVGGGIAMLPFMSHGVSSSPHADLYFVGSYFVGATLGTVIGVSAADRADHFHGNAAGRVAGAAAGVLGGIGLAWTMETNGAISPYTVFPLLAAQLTLPSAVAVMGDRQ
jgi:hypothetical protein